MIVAASLLNVIFTIVVCSKAAKEYHSYPLCDSFCTISE